MKVFQSRTVCQAQGMRLMPWIVHRLGRGWSLLRKALLSDGGGSRSFVANGCRSVLLIEDALTSR
ncbi:MAG: hypothetical protein M3Q30_08030 [Actinomycetota bacterium]|nr:hypothetical protein [Actinomycetota bacterium]